MAPASAFPVGGVAVVATIPPLNTVADSVPVLALYVYALESVFTLNPLDKDIAPVPKNGKHVASELSSLTAIVAATTFVNALPSNAAKVLLCVTSPEVASYISIVVPATFLIGVITKLLAWVLSTVVPEALITIEFAA